MNAEKLHDALGMIDDELIDEVFVLRSKKRRFPVKQISVTAACICLLLIITVLLRPSFENESDHYAYHDSINKEETILETNEPQEGFTSLTNEDSLDVDVVLPENEAACDNSVITSGSSISYVPMLLTIESFTEDGFLCTVRDNRGNENYYEGDRLTVIYADTLEIPEGLTEGDTVYVTYGISSKEEDTVYAYAITYETGDTTPAFFGGK